MSIDLKNESMGPTPFREKSEPQKGGLTCLPGRKPYMFTHFLVLLLVLNFSPAFHLPFGGLSSLWACAQKRHSTPNISPFSPLQSCNAASTLEVFYCKSRKADSTSHLHSPSPLTLPLLFPILFSLFSPSSSSPSSLIPLFSPLFLFPLFGQTELHSRVYEHLSEFLELFEWDISGAPCPILLASLLLQPQLLW